jgi:hypothetical protein
MIPIEPAMKKFTDIPKMTMVTIARAIAPPLFLFQRYFARSYLSLAVITFTDQLQ